MTNLDSCKIFFGKSMICVGGVTMIKHIFVIRELLTREWWLKCLLDTSFDHLAVITRLVSSNITPHREIRMTISDRDIIVSIKSCTKTNHSCADTFILIFLHISTYITQLYVLEGGVGYFCGNQHITLHVFLRVLSK